jgi:hypothetical protein
MPNSIELAESYLPLLDETYKAGALTSGLDAKHVLFINANTVKYFKTSMDGLGDYDRNAGFPTGDVNGTWETLTLTKDRARTFTVDRMDNEETVNMAFPTMAGEFIRTRVVPEIDAYTFSTISGKTGISSSSNDIVIGTTDVPALIDEAEREMNENEVPKFGRVLYISETAYEGLKKSIVRTIDNSVLNVNREVEMYSGMQVVRVPQNRFNTLIELYDGKTSGEEAGGYNITAGGFKINFMIIQPSAIIKIAKHILPRIFSPDINQNADGWKFDYRIYHDTLILENKVTGIYVNRAVTATV